jgi:hypothetical protein
MSIQTSFNNEAINMLPKIAKLISLAKGQSRNNMINITLHEINSSYVPLTEMNEKQIKNFEDYISQLFSDK